MKAALLASLLFVVPAMASAQRVFDTHVHIWNGEASVRAYEAQLKETHQTMTRFAGIPIAERGNMAQTRRKNDELIALAAKYPEMFPIASVHPYDDQMGGTNFRFWNTTTSLFLVLASQSFGQAVDEVTMADQGLGQAIPLAEPPCRRHSVERDSAWLRRAQRNSRGV
jgi:hypothetical protein